MAAEWAVWLMMNSDLPSLAFVCPGNLKVACKLSGKFRNGSKQALNFLHPGCFLRSPKWAEFLAPHLPAAWPWWCGL